MGHGLVRRFCLFIGNDWEGIAMFIRRICELMK